MQNGRADVFWRRDGSSFEIEHTAMPLTESEEKSGTLLLFRNISDQKVAERELRRAKTLYQALADNSQDMTSLTDGDGIILFASKSHEATLGYTSEELIGRPVSLITDPEDFARRLDSGVGVAAGTAATSIHGRMIRKDGSPIPIEATTTIVPGENGAPPMVLSTSRDLSERHEAETQPGNLDQLLLNLAANARDALPHGGTVGITTARCSLRPRQAGNLGLQPGDYVTLAFSDTGSGMSSATAARVFEPFFTAKGEPGTGLGLSAVREVVQQHGGAVDLQSDSGPGALVTIYLPV